MTETQTGEEPKPQPEPEFDPTKPIEDEPPPRRVDGGSLPEDTPDRGE